MKDGYSF